ncbi:MAG: hypothetical protein ACK4IX_04500 [Candidatus Sericytochromatia bacterium]
MSFALLKISKKNPELKNSNTKNVKESYNKLKSNIKVSNKFLTIALSTIVFSSFIALSSGSAKADGIEIASLSKTESSISIKSDKQQKYSGVVLVIKNKNKINGILSPKIVSENGVNIYGEFEDLSNEQSDFVISQGVAAFPRSIDEAERSGSNPLIIEGEMVDNDTFVVSDSDALVIISENNKSKFLENFKVSIVAE